MSELLTFAAGPYGTNCYVFLHEGQAWIIDPGLGAYEQVKEICSEHQVTPVAVLLTHGHIDHTRNAGEIAQHWGVPVFLHHADVPMLTDPGLGVLPPSVQLFGAADMIPIATVKKLHDGDHVQIGEYQFQVIHLPGHSPGSAVFASAELKLMFSGDVLFQGSVGRTDLPGSDPEAMTSSLRKLAGMPADFAVLPGHGPATQLGTEQKTNPYLLQAAQ